MTPREPGLWVTSLRWPVIPPADFTWHNFRADQSGPYRSHPSLLNTPRLTCLQKTSALPDQALKVTGFAVGRQHVAEGVGLWGLQQGLPFLACPRSVGYSASSPRPWPLVLVKRHLCAVIPDCPLSSCSPHLCETAHSACRASVLMFALPADFPLG